MAGCGSGSGWEHNDLPRQHAGIGSSVHRAQFVEGHTLGDIDVQLA
ncbi:MAG: hypothetical protein JOZ65_08400 [Chloroflexi bacterium]|nr:hypothetical protein [Chloroflexota bacterium]